MDPILCYFHLQLWESAMLLQPLLCFKNFKVFNKYSFKFWFQFTSSVIGAGL